MNNLFEPNFGDEFKALIEVAPGMALSFVLALIVAIGRFFYVVAITRNDSVLEAVGLFSPWFFPWLFMLIVGTYISAYGSDIEEMARKKALKRASDQYSARH